jgi:hypothetical protein
MGVLWLMGGAFGCLPDGAVFGSRQMAGIAMTSKDNSRFVIVLQKFAEIGFQRCQSACRACLWAVFSIT